MMHAGACPSGRRACNHEKRRFCSEGGVIAHHYRIARFPPESPSLSTLVHRRVTVTGLDDAVCHLPSALRFPALYLLLYIYYSSTFLHHLPVAIRILPSAFCHLLTAFLFLLPTSYLILIDFLLFTIHHLLFTLCLLLSPITLIFDHSQALRFKVFLVHLGGMILGRRKHCAFVHTPGDLSVLPRDSDLSEEREQLRSHQSIYSDVRMRRRLLITCNHDFISRGAS